MEGRPKSDYVAPDLRERGGKIKDEPQRVDGRLYGQLQVFTGCVKPEGLVQAMKSSGLDAVLYLDVNDPKGVGVFVMAEDPSVFTGQLRDLLNGPAFSSLTRRPELTMIGRTYGTGREPNLKFALYQKPRQTALNPEWPWAVWYPLRRKPEFALLPPEEQGKILHEHAVIGMAWGQAGYAHDVRMACHGLDQDDNEFVIGLISDKLHPLSQMVQEMRKTQQTGKYIQKLGPFFVGKAVWQAPLKP